VWPELSLVAIVLFISGGVVDQVQVLAQLVLLFFDLSLAVWLLEPFSNNVSGMVA